MFNSRFTPWLFALLLAAVFGCGATPPADPSTPTAPSTAATPDAAESPKAEIQWLHDAYSTALTQATQSGRPLVVDMWANWCHTCLSMKHYVLNDPSLAPYADRFIWLALDTDREQNAEPVEQFPINVWPTFFIVNPADQSILARFQGAASLEQFKGFVEHGERLYRELAESGSAAPCGRPTHLIRRGDQAAMLGDLTTAIEAYRGALSAAEQGWERGPEVLVDLIGTLYAAEKWSECVELGLGRIEDTGTSASATDFIYRARACARKLDAADKRRSVLNERAAKRLTTLIDDPQGALSADDRSDAMVALRSIRLEQNDETAARAVALKQLAMLDDAANRAATPQAAATFNWPRAEVYVYLGRGAELIPALEASMRALPEDYDPPYRLAWVAYRTGDLDKALDAVNKALDLAYGPRKGRMLSLLADIHRDRGDRDNERKAREQTIEHLESLPEGLVSPRQLDSARKALADIKR